jgi:TatD DNase family protein
MRLVDVHCHLESGEFAGILPGIVADARKAGVVKLVTNSIVPAQWPESARIAAGFPEVEYAVGIHPWYIQPEFEGDLALIGAAAQAGAVAIGEIGLDSKIEHPGLEQQRAFFEAQLRTARDIDLPVIVHCRGAFQELMACTKKIGLSSRGGIIHNFSGSAELAEQLARLNFSFSLGGTLTYRNSRKKIDLLKAIYPQRFLLETDSPDIPPVEAMATGGRQPNVPANIIHNLRAAAEILGETEESIAEATTANAARILGLSFA